MHAVAAFEAASALTMFGSLLTGPAASAPDLLCYGEEWARGSRTCSRGQAVLPS